MKRHESMAAQLKAAPKTWLVTGVAGFIGSNLLEALLQLDQQVSGLDNFSTGHAKNLAEVKTLVRPEQWARFKFIEGDIRDLATCQRACDGVDYVLHQAALCSVPGSIEDPLSANAINVGGHLNLLLAGRDHDIERLVYASSSAIYGDHPGLPKMESQLGQLLSPYAVTKYVNELYAAVFARSYGVSSIGLRYFNVFGPRQDPDGAYAAVIPKWIAALIKNEPIQINGDGETSRDFCYISNVVQANLLAATASDPAAANKVYNVALNRQTTLNELVALLKEHLAVEFPHVLNCQPVYQSFRPGDVRHSRADISLAERLLGYSPTHGTQEGLQAALSWYKQNILAPRVELAQPATHSR